MAQHGTATPCVPVGEAGDGLHAVPQGPAAVRGLQGQHPVPAKGGWGSAAGLHCICAAPTPDVPPAAGA
ncbi:hypothetical protein V501_02374 [Pseudogymnoascus sp. VKM F-4519 (FW-2642)]|nr:hypothetical protein V501_02374 [Pseudogymnoascus sp. VKM F-4519 (FW-2642)]